MKASENLEDVFPNLKNKEILKAIQDYLRQKNPLHNRPGEKEMIDYGISVITIQAESGIQNKKVLEAHQKFFDVHYVLEGIDVIAYKPIENCENVLEEYNEEGDYMLYSEEPEEFSTLGPGDFCYIDNRYAHAALYKDTGQVKKIVFKVPVI